MHPNSILSILTKKIKKLSTIWSWHILITYIMPRVLIQIPLQREEVTDFSHYIKILFWIQMGNVIKVYLAHGNSKIF